MGRRVICFVNCSWWFLQLLSLHLDGYIYRPCDHNFVSGLAPLSFIVISFSLSIIICVASLIL